jgi:hypothetical protein
MGDTQRQPRPFSPWQLLLPSIQTGHRTPIETDRTPSVAPLGFEPVAYAANSSSPCFRKCSSWRDPYPLGGFDFPLLAKLDIAWHGMAVRVVGIVVSRVNDVAGGDRCGGH